MDTSLKEKLRKHYLFRHLSDEEIADLLKNSRQVNVPAGQIIWSMNENIDYIVIILEGKLKVSLIDPQGSEFAIKYIVPIDSLGDATIAYSHGQLSDVWAVEDSVLLRVYKKDILKILKSNNQATLDLCFELSRRVNNLTRELELQVFSRSSIKIMYKLLQLKPENSCEVKITHNQLAELVGMTRERLTLSLMELEELGYITKKRGKIIIVNPEKLLWEVSSFLPIQA